LDDEHNLLITFEQSWEISDGKRLPHGHHYVSLTDCIWKLASPHNHSLWGIAAGHSLSLMWEQGFLVSYNNLCAAFSSLLLTSQAMKKNTFLLLVIFLVSGTLTSNQIQSVLFLWVMESGSMTCPFSLVPQLSLWPLFHMVLPPSY
jgi:hypothetical protein